MRIGALYDKNDVDYDLFVSINLLFPRLATPSDFRSLSGLATPSDFKSDISPLSESMFDNFYNYSPFSYVLSQLPWPLFCYLTGYTLPTMDYNYGNDVKYNNTMKQLNHTSMESVILLKFDHLTRYNSILDAKNYNDTDTLLESVDEYLIQDLFTYFDDALKNDINNVAGYLSTNGEKNNLNVNSAKDNLNVNGAKDKNRYWIFTRPEWNYIISSKCNPYTGKQISDDKLSLMRDRIKIVKKLKLPDKASTYINYVRDYNYCVEIFLKGKYSKETSNYGIDWFNCVADFD